MPSLKAQQKQDLVDDICTALNTDTRVIKVKNPTLNMGFTSENQYFPDLSRTSDERLLKGSDIFSTLSLSDPILLSIRVPKKNQPGLHGIDDIPSENYYVAWNGVSVIVLWEQDDDSMPLAGGQVVTEILASALRKTGADLYIQACSPDCDNVFIHTSMHVYDDAKRDFDPEDTSNLGMIPHEETGPRSVDVFLLTSDDNLGIVEDLFFSLHLAIESFAEVKNKGRRLLDLEGSIRDQLSHLLSHYYEHASIAARPIWKSIKDRWRTRGWRKEARQLLAGLLLSLANIESLMRSWSDTRQSFETEVREENTRILFATDYGNDIAAIDTLDFGHIDSSIEQVSSSLDNRAIVIATIGGALAGGLAGAIVGLIH
jgi:hypothetical protein